MAGLNTHEWDPDIVGPTDADANLSPRPGALAGDTHDDDGTALDSYFEPSYNGPVSSEGIEYGRESTPVTTRILDNVIDMTNNNVGDSVMAMPGDPNRVSLDIETVPSDALYSTTGSVADGSTVYLGPYEAKYFLGGSIRIDVAVAASAGLIAFESSNDGVTWTRVSTGALVSATGLKTDTFLASSSPIGRYVRVVASTAIAGGTLSVNSFLAVMKFASAPIIIGSEQVNPIDAARSHMNACNFQLSKDVHNGPVWIAKGLNMPTVYEIRSVTK